MSHAEDNLVEAFSLIGEIVAAIHHCKVSLEVIVYQYSFCCSWNLGATVFLGVFRKT